MIAVCVILSSPLKLPAILQCHCVAKPLSMYLRLAMLIKIFLFAPDVWDVGLLL